MGKVFDAIDDKLAAWIGRQRMFFVGTAPSGDGGHVNVSPKGPIQSLRILDPHTVVYQDVIGRPPTASEVTTWRANIASHGWTIPMMRNSFALSAACGSAIDNVVLSALDRHATSDEIALYERFIHDYLWTLVDLKNYLTSTSSSTIEPWISSYPVIFG